MNRLKGAGLLIMIGVFALIEYYSFSAVKFALRHAKPFTRTTGLTIYIVISVLWLLSFALFPIIRSGEISKTLRNVLISFSMGLLIMKALIAIVLLIDDARRLLTYILSLGFKPDVPELMSKGLSRSAFLNHLALLLGGGIFATMLYGMTNRYRYKTKFVSLNFPNLPAAFKGLKIVQISDIHSGSLQNHQAVAKGIEQINRLQPDLILFTGDLVNNVSSEAEEFVSIFSKLKATMGVYSILGNHDYGDYISWESAEQKQANLNRLKAIHAEMGWQLLLDEHRVLTKDGQQIALLGVQNTSFKNRFHTYGDLSKAYQDASHLPFKILMSHDPSHWDGEINTRYTDIDLTLSGHTHGFQFGIDIPGLKWSPVQYIYRQWAGLYQHGKQYLYVNRGFGFLGYPGRVGMLPEITCIELI